MPGSSIPVDRDRHPRRSEDLTVDDSVSGISVASTRWNYFLEHGRWYQDYRGTGYAFPQDDLSLRNEGWTQLLMLYVFDNKHFLAPIDPSTVRNVLDVGTGHGLWPENVADAYPDCHITALDTLPKTTVHPNITFQIMDISQEWIFDDQHLTFDVIHMRSLFGTLNSDAWPGVYEQCFRFLCPGGWVQHVEFDTEIGCDDGHQLDLESALVRLSKLSADISNSLNLEFPVARHMAERSTAAGFVNVEEKTLKIPIGQWPQNPRDREIGRLCEQFFKTGLHGWLIAPLTRTLRYTATQVEDLCKRAFEEIDSGQYPYHLNLRALVAQKPL